MVNVEVTYFDPFDVWPLIQEQWQQRLPLTNLQWNGKSISQVGVDLVVESGHEGLVQVIIISCTSVDDYRQKVRPLIQKWLNPSLKQLIVFFNPEGKHTSSLFKTALIDKFHKDFGAESTVELGTATTQWGALIARLKLLLLSGFQERLDLLKSELETATDKLTVHEKLTNLYLQFSLLDEARQHMDSIKSLSECLPQGEIATLPNVLAPKAITEHTQFGFRWFIFTKQIEMLQSGAAVPDLGPVNEFLHFVDVTSRNDVMYAQFKYQVLNQVSELKVTPQADMGNLILAKRVALCQMAQVKGFAMPLPPKAPVKYTSSLESEEEFQKEYIDLTLKAIDNYRGKERIEGVLNADLALMFYETQQYEKAINILHYSVERFESWPEINNRLFKAYLVCLEKVGSISELTKVYLKAYSKTKNPEFWDHFLRTSEQSNTYELGDILDIEIGSEITCENEVYTIGLEFPETAIQGKVTLVMKKGDSVVEFSSDSMSKSLSSRKIEVGEFELSELRIESNQYTFVKLLQGKRKIVGSQLLRFSMPTKLSLNETKLSVSCPIEASLKLTALDFKFQESEFDTVPSEVWYTTETTNLNFVSELEFTRDGYTFSQRELHVLDITLPISVSVEDIYKPPFTFLKFLIGSATKEPVTIVSVSMEGSESAEKPRPTVISGDALFQTFFKVKECSPLQIKYIKNDVEYEININVEIPKVPIHIAEFDLPETFYTMGQPITTMLKIKPAHECILEVCASKEWLIGGKRKFKVLQECEVPITLYAMRPGRLQLPRITCNGDAELDYKNASQTLIIVP